MEPIYNKVRETVRVNKLKLKETFERKTITSTVATSSNNSVGKTIISMNKDDFSESSHDGTTTISDAASTLSVPSCNNVKNGYDCNECDYDRSRGTSTTTYTTIESFSANPNDTYYQLTDTNINKYIRTISSSSTSIIAINISVLTTGSTSLDKLLYIVQTSENITDVRISGADPIKQTAKASPSVVKKFLQAIEKNSNVIERVAFHNFMFDADIVYKLLNKNNTLTHLALSGCSLPTNNTSNNISDTSTQLQTIAKAFTNNKSIEYLSLLSLDETLLTTILQSVIQNPSLERLDVSYGSLSAAEALGNIISNTISTCSLKHLVLQDSSLSYFEHIVRSLMKTKQKSTRVTKTYNKNTKSINNETTAKNDFITNSIRTLEIINCDMDAISAGLIRTLFRSKHHNIQHFTLSDIDIDDDITDDSSNYCPSLLEDILQGLSYSHSVQHLKLHHVTFINKYDYDALRYLLRRNKNLHRLDLDRNTLSILNNTNNNTIYTNNTNVGNNIINNITATTTDDEMKSNKNNNNTFSNFIFSCKTGMIMGLGKGEKPFALKTKSGNNNNNKFFKNTL